VFSVKPRFLFVKRGLCFFITLKEPDFMKKLFSSIPLSGAVLAPASIERSETHRLALATAGLDAFRDRAHWSPLLKALATVVAAAALSACGSGSGSDGPHQADPEEPVIPVTPDTPANLGNLTVTFNPLNNNQSSIQSHSPFHDAGATNMYVTYYTPDTLNDCKIDSASGTITFTARPNKEGPAECNVTADGTNAAGQKVQGTVAYKGDVDTLAPTVQKTTLTATNDGVQPINIDFYAEQGWTMGSDGKLRDKDNKVVVVTYDKTKNPDWSFDAATGVLRHDGVTYDLSTALTALSLADEAGNAAVDKDGNLIASFQINVKSTYIPPNDNLTPDKPAAVTVPTLNIKTSAATVSNPLGGSGAIYAQVTSYTTATLKGCTVNADGTITLAARDGVEGVGTCNVDANGQNAQGRNVYGKIVYTVNVDTLPPQFDKTAATGDATTGQNNVYFLDDYFRQKNPTEKITYKAVILSGGATLDMYENRARVIFSPNTDGTYTNKIDASDANGNPTSLTLTITATPAPPDNGGSNGCTGVVDAFGNCL
jgi:hypothetical protein